MEGIRKRSRIIWRTTELTVKEITHKPDSGIHVVCIRCERNMVGSIGSIKIIRESDVVGVIRNRIASINNHNRINIQQVNHRRSIWDSAINISMHGDKWSIAGMYPYFVSKCA